MNLPRIPKRLRERRKDNLKLLTTPAPKPGWNRDDFYFDPESHALKPRKEPRS